MVACNTATAAAIHEVRSSHPDLLLVGLEPAIKSALAVTKTGHVGVIGTRGTLTSAKFGKVDGFIGRSSPFCGATLRWARTPSNAAWHCL